VNVREVKTPPRFTSLAAGAGQRRPIPSKDPQLPTDCSAFKIMLPKKQRFRWTAQLLWRLLFRQSARVENVSPSTRETLEALTIVTARLIVPKHC